MSDTELFAAAVALPSAADPSEPVAPAESAIRPMAALRMANVQPSLSGASEAPTPPAFQLPELPAYPSVPGATDTMVAAVVVVFLANTLQSALDGGFPLPVTLPIYLVLVAAFVRLEQLATNHVPVATYTQTSGLLNLATGKVDATDPDGDPLTYSVSTQPTSGIASILPDGTFAYTATGALAVTGGTDTFTVTVDDSLGIQSHPYAPDGHTTTVDVTVSVPGLPINLGPTISSATYSAVNSSSGLVTGKVIATDPEGDAITYSGTTLSGSVVFDANGNFTFTPSATARHAASLALLPVNTATISFTATDAKGAATLTPTLLSVPVVPFNSAPTAVVQVNNPVLGIVTGTVTPADADGDVTTLGPLLVSTAKGSAVVTALGAFTYTPTAAARHAAAATSATLADKTDTFTLTVTDLYGGSTNIPVTVTIAPSNTAPTGAVALGLPDQIGVIRGSVLGLDLVDLDPLTYSAQSATSTLGGIVKVATDGTFTYIPSVPGDTVLLVTTPKPDSFVVNVDDGHGGVTPVTVNVGANLGITASNGSANPTNGAVAGSLNIPAADVGLLTFSSGTAPTKGAVTYTGTGYTYTPTAAARHAAAAVGAPASALTDTFSIVGSDGNGHTISVATVTVAIDPKNTAPTGTATFGTPNASGVVTGTVTATDADADPLVYAGTAGKGSVVFSGTGYTYTPTTVARHAAATDGAGTSLTQDTINLTVSDGYGGVKTISQTVNVTPQNNAPTYANVTKASSGLLGLTKTWTINTPSDLDSDTLTYAVTTLPSGGLLNVPLVTGNVVTLVSLGTEAGKTLIVTMSDGHGGNVPITLTI